MDGGMDRGVDGRTQGNGWMKGWTEGWVKRWREEAHKLIQHRTDLGTTERGVRRGPCSDYGEKVGEGGGEDRAGEKARTRGCQGLPGTDSRPEQPPAPLRQPGPTSPAMSPCTPSPVGPPRSSTDPPLPGIAVTVHAGRLGAGGAGGLAVAAGAACRLPGDRPPRVAQVPIQRRDLARPHLQLLPCKGMGARGHP